MSAKSAYSINTPTATMGIRGTAFDFVIRKTAETDIVIFSGLVRMCGVAGTCFRVTGDCAAVRMSNRGIARAIATPRDRRNMITDGFQFITQQERLAKEFRADLRSCGREAMVRPAPRSGEDRTIRSAPAGPEIPGKVLK
jgi:hypothetical protein